MIGFLVTLAGASLLGLVAVAVPAALRIQGRSGFVIAALVCAMGDVVLVSIALSPEHWLTRAGMLGGEGVIAAVALAGWWLSGRPRPPWVRVRRSAWRRIDVPSGLMVLIALGALTIQLYVGLRVAPSNWDSMTYHLSRAAYWLQYHSVGQYPGASIRQAASGPNAEIMLAWSMLMTGTDRYVELVQWSALIGVGLCVFAGARVLEFSRAASAFAAAVFVVLPEPILQATTTQNDVTVTFFVAATALFMIRGVRAHHLGELTIAGIAAGMAFGAKGDALGVVPSLLLMLAAGWVAWRPPRRLLIQAGAIAAVAVLALGSYNYIANLSNRGSVFGGIQTQVGVVHGTSGRAKVAVEDLWTLANAPGISASWIQDTVGRVATHTLGHITGPSWPFTVDTSIQEDTDSYGLVGFFVLPLLLLGGLVLPRVRRSRRILAGATILAMLAFTQVIDDPTWAGRLLMPSIVLGMPLLAWTAERGWTMGLVGGAAILTMVPCVLQNPQKPLLVDPGQTTVFSWDRLKQMTFTRPQELGIFQAVQARTGPHAAIAFVGAEDSWDYPLFGAHRTHRVLRILTPATVTYRMLRRDHVAGALFAEVGAPPRWLHGTRIGATDWWVPAAGD